jgi:hypothetical protein
MMRSARSHRKREVNLKSERKSERSAAATCFSIFNFAIIIPSFLYCMSGSGLSKDFSYYCWSVILLGNFE